MCGATPTLTLPLRGRAGRGWRCGIIRDGIYDKRQLVAEGLIDFQSKVAQAVKAVGFAFDELDHGSIGQNLNPGVIFLRKRKRT
jgi:hypothetical protein